MRDPERIDPVIDCIRSIWRRYPDLRLMQLLGNAFPDGLDPYHVEDDKTVELLDKTYPVEPPSPNGMALDFESSTTAGSNPVGGTSSPAIGAEELHELLQLVSYDVPITIIEEWLQVTRTMVEEWASAHHLACSDNYVYVPIRPGCLNGYEEAD